MVRKMALRSSTILTKGKIVRMVYSRIGDDIPPIFLL